MLPLSHIYVATKVTGKKSPFLILGSILPDIATTSKNEIGRDKVHNSPIKFYDFVQTNFPNLIDLAIGVRLHSHIDKGADYYSDDNEVGFAKIEGKQIVNQIKDFLGTKDDEIGLVLSHNCVEAGVDLNIVDSNLGIFELYSEIIRNIDLSLVEDCLAKYLLIDKRIVSEELIKLINILGPNNLSSIENCVDGIVLPLIGLRFEKSVDRTEAINIITKSKEIVKNNYIKLLNNAVDNMKTDFKKLLSETY